MEHLQTEKRAILAAALPDIAFDGWTESALLRATALAGYEPAMAMRAFPGGAMDLLDFHIRESDRKMLDALSAQSLSALKMRERIALAVRLRLEAETANREAIRKALTALALPHRAAAALRHLHRTVDAIWYAVGDTSTDFSWYSKRALLAGVYSSTLLFWLDDRSPEQEKTWDFLDRRIANVMDIQRLTGRVDKLKNHFPDPFRLVRRLRGT